MSKKITSTYLPIIFLFISSQYLFAKQYTSVKTGNWNNTATWGTPTTPGATDTVTITNTFTVTVSAGTTINKVTVNSGGTLKLSQNLTINKIIINNGSVIGGRAIVLMGTGIVISGTGDYTGHTGTIQFRGSPSIIDAGVVISKSNGNIRLNNNVTPGITVTNNGQILLNGGNTLNTVSNTNASTFTMGVNSVLTVGNVPLNNNFAVLNASAVGCAVNFGGGGGYNIKIPSGGQFYDMSVITGGNKTNTANLTMHSFTVGSGVTFRAGGFNLSLTGDWTNNSTVSNNTGTTTFNGTLAQNLGGTSSTTFGNLVINNTGPATITLGNSATVNKNFTITSGNFDVSASNYALTVNGNFANNSGSGAFVARNGTVTLSGGATQSLGGIASTSFYNLTVNNNVGRNNYAVVLGNNETIANTLLLTRGSLDASASNYNLTIGEAFTNNTYFNERQGTVTFSGNTSTPLNINGTASTAFYNLTVNTTNSTDQLLLGVSDTVKNNLTISNGNYNTQNFQVTGNGTGSLTMAAGTGLLLGLPTVATNISFPTNYTAGNIALNATSTVTYQANIAQIISVIPPAYGNLVVSNGNVVVIKTPGGTPLTIAGNMTISQGTGALTLSQTVNSINLTGNYTSNGTLSFSTGNFNIGGNFTSNGTYIAGTNTTTFNGGGTQSLGGTSVTTFNNLTINNSGAATITLGNNEIVNSVFTITKGTFDVSASNYALTVNSNFINNASFTARNGTVTMNGGALQSIGGSSTTAFYNLTLGGHMVTLNHNESVLGALTLNSSTATLNGPDTLKMVSNAAGTARIAPVTAGASIGATCTMQRYVSETLANYMCLSSPSKASILKDWDYDSAFYISGVGGRSGNAHNMNGIYYSVYTLDEPKNHWDSVNSDNQPLTPGLGFYLWMGNSLCCLNPFTFATHGIPNVGSVNYSVTRSNNGGNLIGNPYDSPLQWTTFQSGNSSILTGTFYIFDQSGNWESSNGVTGSGGMLATNPNIIPAHQAFYVVASSGGVVTFKETHKSLSDAPLIRLADPADLVRILLTTNANSFSGHALIQFSDTASDNYSPEEDAPYIRAYKVNSPVIYTLSSDMQQLNRNTTSGKTTHKDIVLYAGGGAEGFYTLTFSHITSLTKYNCIVLEDVVSGKTMEIHEGSTYSFSAEDGQINKFIMHFTALQPNQDCSTPDDVSSALSSGNSDVVIIQSQEGAQVRFALSSPEEVTIATYNVLGQQVGESVTTTVWNNRVDVPLPASHQLYIVRVTMPSGTVNKNIFR